MYFEPFGAEKSGTPEPRKMPPAFLPVLSVGTWKATTSCTFVAAMGQSSVRNAGQLLARDDDKSDRLTTARYPERVCVRYWIITDLDRAGDVGADEDGVRLRVERVRLCRCRRHFYGLISDIRLREYRLSD